MAVKVGKMWACGVCGKEYVDPSKADQCRDEHDVIYVPLTKTDLNRLLNFIYIKDETLLTDSLIQTLTKYLRGN